jgi:hypothetical protein
LDFSASLSSPPTPSPAVGLSGCPDPPAHDQFERVSRSAVVFFLETLAFAAALHPDDGPLSLSFRDPPFVDVTIRVKCSPTGVVSFFHLTDPSLRLDYFTTYQGCRDPAEGAFFKDVTILAS